MNPNGRPTRSSRLAYASFARGLLVPRWDAPRQHDDQVHIADNGLVGREEAAEEVDPLGACVRRLARERVERGGPGRWRLRKARRERVRAPRGERGRDLGPQSAGVDVSARDGVLTRILLRSDALLTSSADFGWRGQPAPGGRT
jgi:hypothetical protein